jgi:hypothetical protein
MGEGQTAADKRRANMNARTSAQTNKSRQTDKQLNEKAYREFAEMNAKEQAETDKRNASRLAAIDKWRQGVGRRHDLRSSHAEKYAGLQDKMRALDQNDSGPSQINTDSLARVGGFFGGARAGYDVASKSLQLDKERNEILKELKKATEEFRDAMSRTNGERY